MRVAISGVGSRLADGSGLWSQGLTHGILGLRGVDERGCTWPECLERRWWWSPDGGLDGYVG